MIYRDIKTGLEIIVSSEIDAPNYERVDNEVKATPPTKGESVTKDKPKKRTKRAK